MDRSPYHQRLPTKTLIASGCSSCLHCKVCELAMSRTWRIIEMSCSRERSTIEVLSKKQFAFALAPITRQERAEMVLFLGYDPGGACKHGVACADFAPNGSFLTAPTVMVLNDAGEVRNWVGQNRSAKALGIDTLLAWSTSGGRACDDALRAHCPVTPITVRRSIPLAGN